MKSVLFALSLLAAAPAFAHDFQAGALTIHHPVAIEPPPMALAAAGYLTLHNAGSEADRLIAVEAPPYRAEIHESFEADGQHKMRAVPFLEIPAGGSVELRSGSYHIMFMGEALSQQPLKAGAKLPGTLVFEKAGAVAVTFNVETRKAATAGHSHAH